MRNYALAVIVGFGLAACGGAQNEGEVAPAGGLAEAPAAAEVVAPEVKSVVVGDYVEQETFAVGGVATEFSGSDALFANVVWKGDASRAKLEVKLTDLSGVVVAEKLAEAIQPGETSANFTLRNASEARLAQGTYRLDVYLNGERRSGVDLKIVD